MSAGRSPCAAASSRFTSSQDGPTGMASSRNTRGAMMAAANPGGTTPRFRVPEERTEPIDIAPNGNPRIASVANLPSQDVINLSDGQRVEPQTGLAELSQELTNRPAAISMVRGDRPRS